MCSKRLAGFLRPLWTGRIDDDTSSHKVLMRCAIVPVGTPLPNETGHVDQAVTAWKGVILPSLPAKIHHLTRTLPDIHTAQYWHTKPELRAVRPLPLCLSIVQATPSGGFRCSLNLQPLDHPFGARVDRGSPPSAALRWFVLRPLHDLEG